MYCGRIHTDPDPQVIVIMSSQLERLPKISPLRAILAAGGLALLLLLGVTAPAGAQDYPTPTNPPVSVQERSVSPPPALPRTGSDHTQTLLLVGGGVLLAGAGFVLVSRRQHAKAVEG